jgi:hypothetical protein
MTDKKPWEQSFTEWLATLPPWLRQLVELTPPEREQRLITLGWRATPELRRKIIQGDFEQLKADHEVQVRAWLRIQTAPAPQPEPQPTREKSLLEPEPPEPAFWRRPGARPRIQSVLGEVDAREAIETEERNKAVKRGVSYPVDATQGVPFEQALAWTVGCVGRNRQGYKT